MEYSKILKHFGDELFTAFLTQSTSCSNPFLCPLSLKGKKTSNLCTQNRDCMFFLLLQSPCCFKDNVLCWLYYFSFPTASWMLLIAYCCYCCSRPAASRMMLFLAVVVAITLPAVSRMISYVSVAVAITLPAISRMMSYVVVTVAVSLLLLG